MYENKNDVIPKSIFIYYSYVYENKNDVIPKSIFIDYSYIYLDMTSIKFHQNATHCNQDKIKERGNRTHRQINEV